MLIHSEELRLHLNDPLCVVFDCRHDLGDHEKGRSAFAAGHIPGSFFAPVETALSGKKTGLNGRHPLPLAEDFADFLAAHGVTPETQIVAYDVVGGQYAARLWWLARWVGLSRVAVLDGGYPKWVAEGNPVTRELSLFRPRGHVNPQENAAAWIDVVGVQAGATAQGFLLVDARAPERFRGEVEPIDRIAGHIPGAVNRFFKANLNPDLTLRPAGELRREFEALLAGRDPAAVVHQCGSGITACANLLAMEHAGLGGSRLFPGSWSEWIADPSRRVARG